MMPLSTPDLLYAGGALFLLVFLVWLTFTVYFYLLHRRYAHLPSPKMPSFYLGHLPVVLEATREGALMSEVLLRWNEECGSLFVWFSIYQPLLVTLNPADIKEVLMDSKIPKDWLGYKKVVKIFGERFLGCGLVTLLDYETWKPRRSLYDPAFTKSYLRGLIPSFNKCVDQFLEKLKPLADGQTQVPMVEEFATLTLDIICQVAFGSNLCHHAWSDHSLGLRHTQGKGRLTHLITHTLDGVQKSLRNPVFQYWNPNEAEGYRETVRAIRKLGRECIQKRISAIKSGEQVPNDILTHILRLTTTEKNFDLEDLVDDFATFFIAGQETTALMLTFAIIELHQNPNILQRVLDEISEVLCERQLVTAEDLEEMKYLEQVFSETLRLYPPAPFTMRKAPEGLSLSSYKIPRGTPILISFHANHHNPEHFSDPETFDPSRFDPGRERPSPFVYHPFSAGHRSCIGKTFSMVMIIITGAHKSFALYKAIEEGVNHMWTVSAFQMHPKALFICDDDATLELRVKYFKGLMSFHNKAVLD